MSIPEGGLNNDKIRGAGEIAQHHPAEYIMSRIAEGLIPFGTGVVKGSAGDQVKLPSSASDRMIGVAGKSFEASDFDNGAYMDGDLAGVVETGIVIVKTEEAVSSGDAVRIRHAQDERRGYQEWGFSETKTGASASGFVNDTTKYGALVYVDGAIKEISIKGSAAQTLADVITEINTDLASVAIAALVGGKIRITSASEGASSEVRITDGNDSTDAGIFATLTDAKEKAEDAVLGSGDVSSSFEPGNFCKTAVAGETAVVSGAQWVSETSGPGLAVLYVNGPFILTADI